MDDQLLGFIRKSPDILDHFIEVEGTIALSKPGPPRPSAIGMLSKLPHEALFNVLDNLDFYSLCQFLSTSYGAWEIAFSMHSFRDLVKHASPVLLAMGKTQLARNYTLGELYAVLLNGDCVSCGNYGAFICVITCERACLHCLHHNMRFWVLPLKDAQDIYGIPRKEIFRLTTMRSIPQRGRRRLNLVSALHACALGIELHESREGMQAWVEQGGRAKKWLHQYRFWADVGSDHLLDWNVDAPAQPCSSTWGLAFMRMPFLNQERIVDDGHWCEGCRLKAREAGRHQYRHGWVSDFESIEETGFKDDLRMRELREWTRPELSEHLHRCSGLAVLLHSQTDTGDEPGV